MLTIKITGVLFTKFSKTKIDLPRALKQFVLHEFFFFALHNINSSHDIEYRPIRFLWICSYVNIHVFRNSISQKIFKFLFNILSYLFHIFVLIVIDINCDYNRRWNKICSLLWTNCGFICTTVNSILFTIAKSFQLPVEISYPYEQHKCYKHHDFQREDYSINCDKQCHGILTSYGNVHLFYKIVYPIRIYKYRSNSMWSLLISPIWYRQLVS